MHSIKTNYAKYTDMSKFEFEPPWHVKYILTFSSTTVFNIVSSLTTVYALERICTLKVGHVRVMHDKHDGVYGLQNYYANIFIFVI